MPKKEVYKILGEEYGTERYRYGTPTTRKEELENEFGKGNVETIGSYPEEEAKKKKKDYNRRDKG